MREIKFRGKRIDNGEWIKGGLVVRNYKGRRKIYYIIDEGFVSPEYAFFQEVHPESVGQFTGLLDKNKVEIYGEDIVKAMHQEQGGRNPYERKERVYFNRGGFELFSRAMSGFYVENDMKTIKNCMWVSPGHYTVPTIYYEIINFEVIGNIHDNPELLENNV